MNTLEVVDWKLGVLSICVDDIPCWIQKQFLDDPKYNNINMLTFFYHPGADVVVLNRGHKNFEYYELLVTTYLAIDAPTRQELREKAPVKAILTSLDLLDQVIEERKRHGERS